MARQALLLANVFNLRLRSPQCIRWRNASTKVGMENAKVKHSEFIHNADPKSRWSRSKSEDKFKDDDLLHDVVAGKGKLAPTSSHLFKLILPLGHYGDKRPSHTSKPESPPTIILLHPSQPLSHVSKLIQASLKNTTLSLSYRSLGLSGRSYIWADSTDVGDFLVDAARATKFGIFIESPEKDDTIIEVTVPNFEDRTRYLRRRLNLVKERLGEMEELKKECDDIAHRGARRLALGGFGMLIVYWAGVCRLTWWDYGWEVMEPVTYLSGLTTVICGYLWFLYQGREVSYSSVLHQSVSSRRDALYKARGLDIDRWMDLVTEAKSLKREINKIAEDYDENRRTREEEDEDEKEEEAEQDDEESDQDKKDERPTQEDEKHDHEIEEHLSKKEKEKAKDVSSVADL